MTIYTIACNAIRDAEIALRPIEKHTSLSVHFRASDMAFLITRARTDAPEIISERIAQMDECI